MKDRFLKYKEIDIHNMFEQEALGFLKKELKRYHIDGYFKIIIIHGYRNGKVLKKMILKKLKMNIIENIEPNLSNLGETTIWLKKIV